MYSLLLYASLLTAADYGDRVAYHAVTVAPAETLAVTTMGTGPTVVLLPGMLGGAYAWRHVVDGLVARGFGVVVVELLGTGRSSRPRGADYSLEGQAERVRVVLDSLGVSSALIGAHGIAGSVALRLALAHPARVRGIVSLEGGPAERAGSPGIKRALAFAPLIKLFGGRGLIRGKIRKGLVESAGDPSWVTDTLVEHYAEASAADVGATLATLGAMANAVESQPLDARLGQVSCRVLMLLGGAEHRSGPSPTDLARLSAQMPDYHQRLIAGAGHYLHEERPDEVVRALADF
jgi:pimeloyl-ACP methyl ester carboxylesterase